MRAIRIEEFGGPEVLRMADLPEPEPGEGEVLVRVSRAGINFADTHAREDAYLAKQELPLIPGGEVAGTVERADGAGTVEGAGGGDTVEGAGGAGTVEGAGGAGTVERADGNLTEGQRVVALVPNGGYAELAVAPIATTFPIPDGLDDGAALALVLQGLSAWHLYRTAAQLREGESVVVHAAAGGVGTLAVQLGKAFGAGRVIATASSEEKRRLALELGADAAVDVGEDDLSAALREANGGARVDVILEMAGGRVFDQSLDALAPFGRLVAYGIASREQNEVSNARLLRRSQGVVGFWLAHCFRHPEMIGPPLRDLFERAASGKLRPVVGETYPLSEARRAHEDLQGRRTHGKLLLDPAA